jgi:hypothetical protein
LTNFSKLSLNQDRSKRQLFKGKILILQQRQSLLFNCSTPLVIDNISEGYNDPDGGFNAFEHIFVKEYGKDILKGVDWASVPQRS